MKFPKKKPAPTVRMYPVGKDQFSMIVMEPREVARFAIKDHKWVAEDGSEHKTHRDAMRYIVRTQKLNDLLNIVPEGPASQMKFKFNNKEELIKHAMAQEGFLEAVLKTLTSDKSL